jgi:hypothetical protein
MSSKSSEVRVVTVEASGSNHVNVQSKESTLIVRNPAPDSSPSREPNGTYREVTLAR